MVKPALGYFPTSLSLPYRFRYLPTPEPPADLLAKILAKMAPNTRSAAKAGSSDPNTAVTAAVPAVSSSEGTPLNAVAIPHDDDVATETTQPHRSTPSSPTSFSFVASDSSDSDSDDIPYQSSTATSKMGNSEITVAGHGKRPSVSSGNLTPSILLEFSQYCKSYFEEKEIAEDKQTVRSVLFCFKDVRISTYISANQAVLRELPFDEFVMRIRDNFLPHDWADSIRDDILRSVQKKDQSWREYTSKVARDNAVLTLSNEGSIPEDRLMQHLAANMSDHLRSKMRPITIPKKITISGKEVDIPLLQWTEFIARYDDDLRLELKRAREIADEVHRNAKRQNTGAPSGSSRNGQRSDNSKTGFLPALTDAEHKLLNEHQGCRKCRRFYAGHISKDCRNGFPKVPADGYKELTLQKALDEKKKSSGSTSNTSLSTV
ncbi:hypothetical protein EST38_g9690 [Candolleomyces aberdarensis]|uniref:Uncharacterized protein n=1 Tax=Candolleomyces aberdarensis TaxID=2316362 RepID=A0A4Q2DC61_9AGAR|nr:hypothetical protein EST38_g9690 [Candolleomyces aberdarensis]